MREYAKKPESQSRTLDSDPRASRQAPIDVILQRYKERNIQRYASAEEEEVLQGKLDTVQLNEIGEDELLQGKFESTPTIEQKPVQREEKPNNTGLPDNLKASIENLSGYSMDDVRVHYNSDKPAQLQALAYTQGTDIHVASGQEKHLAHEAWHVIQQKQGRVQPTMQLQGININDDEKLEKEADNMTFSMQMPIISYDQNVIQLMGAIPLKRLLKFHGIEIEDPTIKGYDDFCKKYPLDFNQQLSKLNEVTSEDDTIRKIIANEKNIVENQRRIYGEDPSETINKEIEKLALEKLDLEKTIKEQPHLKTIKSNKINAIERDIERLVKLSAGDSMWRQQDSYEYMDTGSEWTNKGYSLLLTKGDRKVEQLSKANLESITNAEIHYPTEVIRFNTLDKYEPCVERIRDLLVNNTILSHYSPIDNIPVLLSKEYAISSQIKLATDNSDKRKEQELKNTGFVFFFLERKNGGLRTNTRFGKYRYSLETKYAEDIGMLNESWVMLSDFIKAYTNYAKEPKKISLSQGTDGTMTFDKSQSLTGKMTYGPTGMTLQFEKFHNILVGADIIIGLSGFATQQLYAMFGDFGEIVRCSDDELLDAVLKMFEIQVMVPGAVVPQKMELCDTTKKEEV